MKDTVQKVANWLRRANAIVALAVGVILLLTCCFILLDIILRKFGAVLGGSDEISGYVMAIIASWGLSFGLTELAHVRIDIMRVRFGQTWQAYFDVISILFVFFVVTLIAFQAWPVLEKTLANGSLANTSLMTPLWIPQLMWFAGWVWFSVSAGLLLVLSCILLGQRQYQRVAEMTGINPGNEEVHS